MTWAERIFPFRRLRAELQLGAALEPPIRDEILGLERLETHARHLAQTDQRSADPRQSRPLLPRLQSNKRALFVAQRLFAAEVQQERVVPPAAEWLLDNFYIVQNHLHQIEQDLSRAFYRELPKLAAGRYAGYPRVYGLTLELLAHTDSRVDPEGLARYVRAYQSVTPLTTGELWAIAIMLRIGLVENLRRLMTQSLATQRQRAEAARWANRLLRLSAGPPTQFVLAVADLAKNYGGLNSTFIVHLLERLRDQSPAMAPVVHWLEQWLAERGTNLETLTRSEHKRRAADRISVGHVFVSLRAVAGIDWADFFEDTSALEAELRQDPGGVYAAMDFATRDRYRHVVEKLSKRLRLPETEVAQQVVGLASAAPPAADDRLRHVGYYLIDRGQAALEAALHYRPSPAEHVARWARRQAAGLYLSSLALLAAVFLAGLLAYGARVGLGPLGLVLLGLLTVLPASVYAISLINWAVTVYLSPRPLPKLEFAVEIPAEQRTMVVVPALLSSEAGIHSLFENLEIRYLANRESHLHFALLGDFADASEAHRPEDDALVAMARQRVDELNARYGQGRADRFYFFQRRRLWNPSEGVWMGWERKRGKLIEFNRLLGGQTNTSYTVAVGDPAILPEIKYVITLDADTELPINSARRMVGAMAHPLNRPILHPRKAIVTQGYGILQPRTAVTALAATETRFARIMAGDTGLDPYSTAISSVYQDLFEAGSYIGKAIYDVNIMRTVLDGRFPENLLLSHDLLEGAYVRVGQLTEVQLLENFPSGYDAFMHRQHRWIRGDWQILNWLLPRVPNGAGGSEPNPLPLIARWKILDNLRQSLVAPATVLLLVLGWLVLPGWPWVWTGVALLAVCLPVLFGLVLDSGLHPVGEPWLAYVRNLARDMALNGQRLLLIVSLLLNEALVDLDAIVRVAVRRFILHRHLLEWQSAAVVEHGQARTLGDYLPVLWSSPVLALGLLTAVALLRPMALPAAVPVLLAWLAAPLLAVYLSRPASTRGHLRLPEAQQRELRVMARKIWRFYEDFAGEGDHWLPPDNYQVEPNQVVAHRTSPTNIGFLLLSALAAYDFGFITPLELLERLERVLSTLETLQRHRGHLFNWYDTRTLTPLPPEYVSTVDSGNLAASLIALKQACLEIITAPVVQPAARAGLEDTARALRGVVEHYHPAGSAAAAGLKQMLGELQRLEAVLAAAASGPAGWGALLERLAPLAQAVAERGAALELVEGAKDPPEIRYWSRRLAEQVTAQQALLATLPSAITGEAWPSLADLAETSNGPAAGADQPDPATPCGLRARWHRLAERAEQTARAMDFGFLYNDERGVFTIGYNHQTQRLDNSYYDLLASEARLASLVAIAAGQVPARHWFRLSRPLAWAGGSLAVLSWGGTMFEYLMPNLLLQDFEHTLLAQSVRAAVEAQQQYGLARRAPWGISESGYYAFDYQFNYQYQSFGVPDLGLKRERAENMVVAPYATFLALALDPPAAWDNLQYLAREGLVGTYGYYEAIDYTPSRRPRGQRAGLVRSFMAHHQGMSLVALANYLQGQPMLRRFHAEPAIAAVELLLQERVPRHVPIIEPHPGADLDDGGAAPAPVLTPGGALRTFNTPHTLTPRAHLLSNGAYQVMITNAGGGYSAYMPPDGQPAPALSVTRWRPDLTRDNWGTFIYVKDLAGGQVWSAAYQPTGREPESYEVNFAIDRAVFRRRDQGIETDTEIVLTPRDDVEVRRVTLTNTTRRPRTLAVTSYAEVALDVPAAELAHPAFSKLFIESEYLPARQALLFRRRPRAAGQTTLWALHQVTAAGELVGQVEYETDRARFVGRGRGPRNPEALDRPLSNTTGAVLDPLMSLRCTLRLNPGESTRLTFITGVVFSREAAEALADRYDDNHVIETAMDLAWVYSQIQLRHLNITDAEAHLFQRLASRVLYPDPALRAAEDILSQNVRGQSGLWGHGLSGDVPVVLVRVDEAGELDLVRDLLHAHEYWRLNTFSVDLVIFNEHPATYAEGLQGQIQAILDTSLSRPWQDKPGGVFVRRADHMAAEDRILLMTVARVVLDGDLGSLADQLERSPRQGRPPEPPPKKPEAELEAIRLPGPRAAAPPAPPDTLSRQFFNGLGGFSADGREYVITLNAHQMTPAPWINVLANEHFGCLTTDNGLGYTWSENSQMNRLTPWSNDPVADPPGEVLYLRDDATGAVWTPTPLPIRENDPAAYTVRHGAGYTVYERRSHELAQSLLVTVPREDAVKLVRLQLTNLSTRPRSLSVTAYVEWVLGTTRTATQHFIVTERDPGTGALFATNTYSPDFAQRIAFAYLQAEGSAAAEGGRSRRGHAPSFTTDRTEFIGRNRSMARPAAMGSPVLSGRLGAGFDPCAAQRMRLEIPPGQTREVLLLLGQGHDREAARTLINRYRQPGAVQNTLEAVTGFWDTVLGTVQVQTPDPAMDVLLNRWLLYQALACRFWGRSAFYQSGGAYGFRDQLQDSMALVLAQPALAREHLLRAAARQFVEGDVQHWWHAHNGQGVRTRFSDDYLWLPFVTHYFVSTTGDTAVLDEPVLYLKAPLLEPDQHEAFVPATPTAYTGSLYEHCVRAVDNGLRFGQHGLPLMGIGDWNDGMNHVGPEGKGESVWLGWFLYDNLEAWAGLAAARGEAERAEKYRAALAPLKDALETHGWDGEWYRRAYFDDGTPLGSAQNEECQIDSIAQSWAVLSRAGQPARLEQAYAAAERQLVSEEDDLIKLLTPPFDKSQPDPGYIQGYVPGIRENGAQYTHAALWFIWGYAARGLGDRAHELFGMINPVNHALTPEAVERYKVEPYVIAADVYAHPQHRGRGGWTWYTGSAAWMWRLGVEGLLGLQLRDGRLAFDPCLPKGWPGFTATIRRNGTTYAITVENPHGVNRGVAAVELDGQPQPEGSITLAENDGEHRVRVVMVGAGGGG